MNLKKIRSATIMILGICLTLILACPLSASAEVSSQQTATGSQQTATSSQQAATSTKQAATNKRSNLIVMIDPGHQEKGNYSKEKTGPGSKRTKAKVSSGTRGVSTHTQEYKLTLTVARQLRDILQKRGYTVYMVRNSNKVNISNKQRALMANKVKADIFIRIHANGSTSRGKNGVETICMTKNSPYNKKLYKNSYALSKCLLDETVKTTKAKKLKVMQSNAYTGINWSKVPVSIIEMGYMSNAAEDRKMSKKSYQQKLATGMANGIDAYFKKIKKL